MTFRIVDKRMGYSWGFRKLLGFILAVLWWGSPVTANASTADTFIYQTFDLAYRYAFVELEIDGKTYTLQPIDYVGETPLENGNYTYSIEAAINERYNTLSLNLMYDAELLQ